MAKIVFELVSEDNIKKLDENNLPTQFSSFATAKEAARIYTSLDGKVWTVKKVVTPSEEDWEQRELQRFEQGEYLKPVWLDMHDYSYLDSTIKELAPRYAHVSRMDQNQIAYTPDREYGILSRKRTATPRGYLLRFHPRLPNNVVEHLIASHETKYGTAFGLKIARTMEEAVHIYEEGPDSCMSHPASEFSDDVHPAMIYSGPDLYVAYLENCKSITARCIIWEDKKIHSQYVYGDRNRLELRLSNAGYHPGSLTGARLKKIASSDGGWIGPYIDGTYVLREEKEYFVLDESRRGSVYFCQGTDGRFVQGTFCDRCSGCETNRNNISTVHTRSGEESWCCPCTDTYSVYVEAEGQHYQRGYFEEIGFFCTACQQSSIGVPHIVPVGLGELCDDCYEASVAPCEVCGVELFGECPCV